MKNIFIIVMLLVSFAFAKEIVNNSLKEPSFIIDCANQKNKEECTKTPIPSGKNINQNDLLFLGERLYMDNYNPLNFSSSTKVLENLINK